MLLAFKFSYLPVEIAPDVSLKMRNDSRSYISHGSASQ